MMSGLNGLYLAKAAGKEAQPDIDLVGPQATSLDIWVLFLAVESLLLVVADVEAVVDMVVKREEEEEAAKGAVQGQVAATGMVWMLFIHFDQLLDIHLCSTLVAISQKLQP
jgi:hypothetical protein